MAVVDIKKVTLNDLAELQNIGKRTFFETFAADNSAENMSRYLAEGFSLDKLTRELENGDSAFYFATRHAQTVGYLKINFSQAQTEMRDKASVEIERIYVLKEFHGQKVGQLLYDKALEIARQANARYLWLGVWEKNPRAISFYKKNGFVEFDRHLFKLGDDEQIDLMMRLELNE